ncbi:MAG: hypothetical protein R3245_13125, partial [Kiloniellales bacterium]|nr:hypothetical protein [Kiloniellales bacterium]
MRAAIPLTLFIIGFVAACSQGRETVKVGGPPQLSPAQEEANVEAGLEEEQPIWLPKLSKTRGASLSYGLIAAEPPAGYLEKNDENEIKLTGLQDAGVAAEQGVAVPRQKVIGVDIARKQEPVQVANLRRAEVAEPLKPEPSNAGGS